MASDPLKATVAWKLINTAQKAAFKQNKASKGGTWLAVGLGFWGLQRVRSMAARQPEVLFSEKLEPGQSITISHEMLTRKQDGLNQKLSRKAEKVSASELKKQRKLDAKAAKRTRKAA